MSVHFWQCHPYFLLIFDFLHSCYYSNRNELALYYTKRTLFNLHAQYTSHQNFVRLDLQNYEGREPRLPSRLNCESSFKYSEIILTMRGTYN